MRVLTVTDDRDLLMRVKRPLIRAKIEMAHAEDTSMALDLLDHGQWDIVLVDASRLDGAAIVAAERASEHGAEAVVMSGYAAWIAQARLRQYSLVPTPIDPAALMKVVASLAQRARKGIEEPEAGATINSPARSRRSGTSTNELFTGANAQQMEPVAIDGDADCI